MKLIKCDRCGRPYYDSQTACPYCTQSPASSSVSHQETQQEDTNESQQIPKQEIADEPVVDEVPSATVIERANSIAAVYDSAHQVSDSHNIDNPVEIETIPEPRKKRFWLWILLVIVLLFAVAVWLKWDLISGVLTSMLS